MLLDTKRGGKKVTISTTTVFRPNLEDSKKYQTYGMNQMEHGYKKNTYGVSAQILLGADQARSFPHKARDKNGDLLQTEQAQLMQIAITGSYIIFGSCGKHSKKAKKNKSWIGSNQVQVSSSVPGDEEILISIMDTMTLEDMDFVEDQQESD